MKGRNSPDPSFLKDLAGPDLLIKLLKFFCIGENLLLQPFSFGFSNEFSELFATVRLLIFFYFFEAITKSFAFFFIFLKYSNSGYYLLPVSSICDLV